MNRRANLSGRLSRLKKGGLKPPNTKNKQNQLHVSYGLDVLKGWEKIHTDVWRRQTSLKNPLNSQYKKSLQIPYNCEISDLLFYDTETTGLSTGAGTIAFLVGVGFVRGDRMEIVQYFLSDYPGELAMLKDISRMFDKFKLFISYNGKTYDSHLLNTRFLMNGLPVDLRQELDLLYICRRLWKGLLVNCRLGTIEDSILQITRGPDIPGGEIPDVWFEFLKTGNTEKLSRVFSHNLQDIHSLAVLLDKTEMIIAGKDRACIFDSFALARFLLFHDRKEGLSLLIQEFESGNSKAGEFLSLYYKRSNDWENAVFIWEKLNDRGLNIFGAIELAKFYEHREKNYRKALSYIDPLLKGPLRVSQFLKEELIHRKKRLLKKINEKPRSSTLKYFGSGNQ